MLRSQWNPSEYDDLYVAKEGGRETYRKPSDNLEQVKLLFNLYFYVLFVRIFQRIKGYLFYPIFYPIFWEKEHMQSLTFHLKGL